MHVTDVMHGVPQTSRQTVESFAVFSVEQFAYFSNEFMHIFWETTRHVDQFADFSMLKTRNDPTEILCLRGSSITNR